MAPEHEAHTRALYDHEVEEPGRRRHAVADWGVGEDIFDRMPSRRFNRAERRAEHSRTLVISRSAPADAALHSEPAAIVVETEPAGESRRAAADESWREPALEWRERAADEARGEPAGRMIAASEVRREPAPPVAVAPPEDAPARRTVLISGHPGGLPMARPARPPRTAIERVGTSPDRIVAYAVALGFLLVLIAVLTTGQ